jgi:hypothetical protein
VPGPDGRSRRAARRRAAAREAERISWERLPPGAQVLSEVGRRPRLRGRGGRVLRAQRRRRVARHQTSSPAASRARWCRTVAHGASRCGSRPGQRAADIGPELERLLREGAHPDADVSFKWHLADPSLFEPDLPALVIASRAIERATGTAPALVRSGGSIPVVAEFAARAIPTIVSGFGLPDDDIHAPNESYRLESLELGSRTARELLISLADL